MERLIIYTKENYTELGPCWEARILKNFPTFYGTWKFINVLTWARHWSLPELSQSSPTFSHLSGRNIYLILGVCILLRVWDQVIGRFLYPPTQRHYHRIILLLILLYCYMFRSYDHLQVENILLARMWPRPDNRAVDQLIVTMHVMNGSQPNNLINGIYSTIHVSLLN
jgi:hypothetical protein